MGIFARYNPRGVQVLVAAFKDEATADAAYKELKQGANSRWLDDVAIVVHEGDKVKFKESKDMGGGGGAVAGAAVGAVVGLFFPPALVITTVGGAVIGGLTAKLHDANLPDKDLRQLGEHLKPGAAAIVAVVDENMVPQATDALKRLGASVATEGLDPDTVSRLTAETPSSETPSSETPSSETPSSETPSSETPSSETPSSETPSSPATGATTPEAGTSG